MGLAWPCCFDWRAVHARALSVVVFLENKCVDVLILNLIRRKFEGDTEGILLSQLSCCDRELELTW